MGKFTSLVKFVFKTTFKAFSRVALMVIFGIVLNLILLFFLPDMCSLDKGDASLMEYVGNVASGCTPALIFGLLFAIGFPFAYFFLAQKFGVQSAIHYAYVENKPYFYQYFTDKMMSHVAKKQANSSAGLMEITGKFLTKLNDVPFIFRIIINFLKDKIPFLEVIEKISNQIDISPNANVQEVAQKLATEADVYVQDELLRPSLWLFWIVLAVNLGVFGLVHLVY